MPIERGQRASRGILFGTEERRGEFLVWGVEITASMLG